MGLRVPIEIDIGTAESCVTLVLLDGGSGPSSEGSEVAERRIVVIMCVPQRIRVSASPTTHDGAPLRLRGVNSDGLSKVLGRGDGFRQPVLVIRNFAPVLRAFNIKPEHAIRGVVLFQIVDGISDLRSSTCGAKRAREHVNIDVLNSSSFSVIDSVGAIGIRLSSALKGTNDGEIDTLTDEALPSIDEDLIRDVNADRGVSVGTCEDQSAEKEEILSPDASRLPSFSGSLLVLRTDLRKFLR